MTYKHRVQAILASVLPVLALTLVFCAAPAGVFAEGGGNESRMD